MTLNLFQTRFWADDETLIALSTADFQSLLTEGQLEWTSMPGIGASTIALACDASVNALDFEDEPEASLDTFLKHTRIVTHLLNPVPALALADPEPLREVLLRTLPEATAHLPKLPVTKKRWYEFWEH